MVGIRVSSYSEYKVKNGLSSIEQFRNLGQNGTCYYIVFDEWKDTLMYTVYVVVLNQNTPVVGKTLFWGSGWRGGGGGNKFSVLFKGGTENFYSSLWGKNVFQHMFSISGVPLMVINGTSLSTNESKPNIAIVSISGNHRHKAQN